LISLTSICAVIGIDRESAASYLKKIIVEFITLARQRKLCALNLGIGWLVANIEGELKFTTENINVPDADVEKQEDNLIHNINFGIGKDSVSIMRDSVMTPYTNIGKNISTYNGRNELLKNWYTPAKTY